MTKSNKSQFHSGEISIQERLGITEQVAKYSQEFIREAMPDKHRQFFNELPFVIIGLTDHEGFPWSIPMFGSEGFVQSPNETTLKLNGIPSLLNTLNITCLTGKKIGLLGIQFSTRRRNRINGVIDSIDNESLSILVEQSFGNCPKYIRKRELNFRTDLHVIQSTKKEQLISGIDANSISLIERADTFFIASRTKYFDDDKRNGIDSSHRGGNPGFVTVINHKLQFPDYSGNGFFNTLGNIESDSRVGLFFPDFLTGGAVFISGLACILWNENDRKDDGNCQRIIEVKIEKSVYLPDFMPMTETSTIVNT